MVAIAAFVTAHGYGHAARVCAVLDAIGRAMPGLRVELFTDAPGWFFEASLRIPARVHQVRGDVGLVQRNALDADLEATVTALDRMLPFGDGLVTACAESLVRLGCRAVLADIAPLGVVAGRRAGVPTVLVENFTWDWIYRRLERSPQRLLDHAAALEATYRDVDLRLRAEPACGDLPGRPVPLIWRPPRSPAAAVRRRLGIPPHRPMVLVSMGGARWDLRRLAETRADTPATFVIPGAGDAGVCTESVVALPTRSGMFHPDLVAAADVVVGKLGYSTVAEAVGAGTAFAWVPRDGFPESPVLEEFVRRRLPSTRIDREAFEAGDWHGAVHELLRADRSGAGVAAVNGADAVASQLLALLDR